MNDPNSLHRKLKEQEFSTRSEAGEARYETETDTEEQQQIAVLGEVVVVAKSLVIGGVAVALRWRCGAVQLRWSCGGTPPRLAWPRRRPVLEKELCTGKMEVPGPAFFGQWSMLYIGAAEMAQGRGRWRKWRRASVGDGSGAGPWLVTEVARGRGFSAFCSDAHGLLPALSPLCLVRFLPLQADRFPREVAPSRGFHPREAKHLAKLPSSRGDKSSRSVFSSS